MKIGFISDLHYDLNAKNPPNQYIDILCEIIKENQLEILILCGDISEHYTLTLYFVELLERKSKSKVYFIPGNHDYFSEKRHKNTWETYYIFARHPQSLLESPLKLNDEYSIIGHSAWYNHSFQSESYTPEEAEKGIIKGNPIGSKKFINWKESDKNVSSHFSKIIENDFKKSKTSKYILVTHMLTNFNIAMDTILPPLLYAYGGTDDLQPLFESYNITHSIMGHLHERIEFEENNTTFVCCSLGYTSQWKSNFLDDEIRDAIYILEL